MVKRADDTAPAILQSDPLKRLDAIIRRHGGKPKAETPPRSDDAATGRPPGVQGADDARRGPRR